MKILLLDHNVTPKDWGARELREALHDAAHERGLAIELTVRRPEPGDLPVLSAADALAWDAIVLSGSLHTCTHVTPSPWLIQELTWIRNAYQLRTPILGICFGHQILARALLNGAPIGRRASTPEHGWTTLRKTTCPSVLLEGLPAEFVSLSSHYEEVEAIPPKAKITSTSPHCAIQSYESVEGRYFATQFHPERDLTGGETTRSEMRPSERHRFIPPPRAREFDPRKVGTRIFGNFLSFVAALSDTGNTHAAN